MITYVLGAGASYPVYPLAIKLLERIDNYIHENGKCFNRFNYADWPAVMRWFADNPNPLLRQAFHNGNIEQIFTVLDLAESLVDDSLVDILRASKMGAEAVAAAKASHKKLAAEASEYQHKRRILMWAVENFFQEKHSSDQKEFNSDQWKTLREFGELLHSGDTVITFNYDTTVERVLLNLGKWSPADGYGEHLVFQAGRNDERRVTFAPSQVKVLHLHGAVGWYRKPSVKQNSPMRTGGLIPREARTPAPLETTISIDPIVLRDFGIPAAVDASMPDRPSDEYQILLHPSFLKDYTGEDNGNSVFVKAWRMAAEALRLANRVVIIGYSLPPADSAAWALLLANCDSARTIIVNPDPSLKRRYRRLLSQPVPQMSDWFPPQCFADWVAAQKQMIRTGNSIPGGMARQVAKCARCAAKKILAKMKGSRLSEGQKQRCRN